MKLIVARVIPLALALLLPSYALAETPSGNKPHKAHTQKRAKAPKATKKAPKVKAPKASKKAPKASKAAKKSAL